MSSLLSIALCEDNPQDAAELCALLAQYAPEATVAQFTSAEAFLASQPAGRFGLVFFDVYLGGITGIEAARRLREQDKNVSIVFTTTSEDHALDGYRVRALHYLIKPVQAADVAEVLAECRLKATPPEPPEPGLTLMVSGQKQHIALADVQYVEVFGKRCLVHTSGGVVETRTPMEQLAQHLPAPHFVRCHRAYIVNLAHVAKLDGDFVMENGDIVYVRVKNLPEINKAWNRYMAQNLRKEDFHD